MKVTTPIYARADTMAALLDMSITSFNNLVRDGILPEGVKFREQSSSMKIWKVADVCSTIDTLQNDGQTIEDEFDRALN